MMTLLLQLNGDLTDRFPGHERRLYIFACRAKPCRRKEGSIRAIRAVRVSKTTGGNSTQNKKSKGANQESSPKPPDQKLGHTVFNTKFRPPGNANANPFSTSVAKTPNPFSPNPFCAPNSSPLASKAQALWEEETLPATFAQKVRLSAAPPPSRPPSPWPQDSALPPPYPSYHLDADFETLDTPSPTPSHSQPLDLDNSFSVSNKDSVDDAGAFESDLDKTFHRFADRLAQNPLQVLRYEFDGSPLLYSKSDAVGLIFSYSSSGNSKVSTLRSIPRCGNCRAERVFELQLTPQTIAELEVDEEGIEGMEWGSVVLGVCAEDCEARGADKGDVGWVEEWVGVQWEEVGGPGKR